MLSVLLAASLNLLTLAPQHPPAPAPAEEPAQPVETGKAKPVEAGKAKPMEAGKAKAAEPALAHEAARPLRRKGSTVAVPVEDAAPQPVSERAPAAPRRPARPAPRPAPPAAAQAIPAADARMARLQVENALLRRKLAEGGSAQVDNPQAALAELLAGNLRFLEGARVRTLMSMEDLQLRQTMGRGQVPFAVILTCSDSQMADNLLFDQELGRLFSIREAGNSLDTQGLASVEYAIEYLGARLVVVLGHNQCGAVKAVKDAHGMPLPGNLWALQAAMAGLLESTPEDPNEDPAAYMDRLVLRNTRRQAQAVLDRSEIVRARVARGQVKVVPAVYDLASGRVAFGAATETAQGGPHR